MSGFKLLDDSSLRGATDATPLRRAGHADQALGLTVHSMPAPEQVLALQAQRTRRGRWKMMAVLLVCAAPVLASYFTYYVVRPEGRRNFGDLIEPQRPLPDQASVSLAAQDGNLKALAGQWLLVSVAGGACDPACQRQLYLQRQLRESLGRERDRLDRVWLITDQAPVPATLLPALQGATVLRVPEPVLSDWLQAASGHQLSEHLYVVDPMGNWMLRFPAQLDLSTAPRAKRDLERLLRASRSWDQAGRAVGSTTAQ